MKKPKIDLSGEAVKGFFTYHVEKLILGVVLLMVGLFVMWGYQLEGYTAYTPDVMKQETESARSKMTRDDVWPDIQDDETRIVTDTEERMKKGIGENSDGKLPPIPGTTYPVKIASNQPLFAPNAKRADPQVFAAMEVEVEAGFGPLAMPGQKQSRGELNQDDPSSIRDPLLRAARMYQIKLEEEEAAKVTRPSRSGRRESEGLLGEGDFSPPRSDFGGGRSANEIPLTEEQETALSGFAGTGSELPQGVNYVAVTALAPLKKQWDEYEAVLKDSAGYDLARDTPQYVWVEIQRAEVGPDGQLSPWEKLKYGDPGLSGWFEQKYYAGTSADIVDPRYTSTVMTRPVPPIMLRDLTELSVHSKTPLISLQDDTLEEDTNSGIDFNNAEGPDIPEINRGPTGVPNTGRGGSGEGQGSNPYLRDSFGEEGEGGRRGNVEGGLAEQELVDYKLVRFFDFYVVPGKKYKYRVQVWVSDPNHPLDPAMTPPPALLQEEVLARTAALDRAQGNNRRVFYRKAEWSEPSETVSIPQTWEVLAGEMEKTKMVPIRLSNNEEVTFEMPGEEPMAHLMTLIWNPKYAADIPGELDIYRGSVLNFTTNVNVLHSSTAQVVTLPDYKFDTNAMVLDMRGGHPLPNEDREDPLMEPTEMLIIDSEGNMIVKNELDDTREFRLNDYEKPPEPEIPDREELEGEEGEGGLLFEGEGERRPRRGRRGT